MEIKNKNYIFAKTNIMSKLSKEETKKRKAEYAKEYRKKHPEYLLIRNPMRRADYLLQAYKQKDKLRGRGNSDLTAKWLVENILFKPCAHCGKEGWDIIGCNRLDNSKPHTKDNVEPCCEDCNNKPNLVFLIISSNSSKFNGLLSKADGSLKP